MRFIRDGDGRCRLSLFQFQNSGERRERGGDSGDSLIQERTKSGTHESRRITGSSSASPRSSSRYSGALSCASQVHTKDAIFGFVGTPQSASIKRAQYKSSEKWKNALRGVALLHCSWLQSLQSQLTQPSLHLRQCAHRFRSASHSHATTEGAAAHAAHGGAKDGRGRQKLAELTDGEAMASEPRDDINASRSPPPSVNGVKGEP